MEGLGFPLTLLSPEIGHFITAFLIFCTCYISVMNVVDKFVISSIGYKLYTKSISFFILSF